MCVRKLLRVRRDVDCHAVRVGGNNYAVRVSGQIEFVRVGDVAVSVRVLGVVMSVLSARRAVCNAAGIATKRCVLSV